MSRWLSPLSYTPKRKSPEQFSPSFRITSINDSLFVIHPCYFYGRPLNNNRSREFREIPNDPFPISHVLFHFLVLYPTPTTSCMVVCSHSFGHVRNLSPSQFCVRTIHRKGLFVKGYFTTAPHKGHWSPIRSLYSFSAFFSFRSPSLIAIS